MPSASLGDESHVMRLRNAPSVRMQEFRIIRGYPAVYLRGENAVVISDNHLGAEFRLFREGFSFPGASMKQAEEIVEICRMTGAKKVISLGDVKDSILYPPSEEYSSIQQFFRKLEDIKFIICRGNHDSHLGEILEKIGANATISKEFSTESSAFLHGNAMPSESLMKKRMIFIGHGHFSAKILGFERKAFILSKPGEGISLIYKKWDRRIRLLALPSFSRLVFGTDICSSRTSNIPLFRRHVFEVEGSAIFTTDGKKAGVVHRQV